MIKMLQISLLLLSVAFSQVAETETRYVKISSLQSHFSAYGSERAWNNSYYEGLRWPADYPYQHGLLQKILLMKRIIIGGIIAFILS